MTSWAAAAPLPALSMVRYGIVGLNSLKGRGVLRSNLGCGVRLTVVWMVLRRVCVRL